MLESVDLHRVTTFLSKILEDEHQIELGPEFKWYFRNSFSKSSKSDLLHTARRFVRELVDDFKLAGSPPSNMRILDAGCGFGIRSVLMRLMGAAQVYAIDSNAAMISTFQKYLRYISDLDGVFPQVGNAGETCFPDRFFDFVFCNEAISHFYDVPGFLDEMHRVLKIGGTLFISDANNGANPYIAWRTRKIWERFEQGPCGDVLYSRVENTYFEKRTHLISDTFPDFSRDEVAALALGTFQCTRSQILDACWKYKTSGELPKSFFKRGRVPIDPEIDNYQENLIFPQSLSRQLRLRGFRVKVYSYLGGAGGNPIVRMANRIVVMASPLSWPVARVLKVVAIKKPPL